MRWSTGVVVVSIVALSATGRMSEARRGRPALPSTSEFPDVVLVGDLNGFHCSGVVLDARHALTAAHCLPATRVAIGDTLDDAAEVVVDHFEKHPAEDIALLVFSTDLPVRTHSQRVQHEAPVSELAIVGFGVSDPVRVTGFGTKRVRLNTPDGWGCDYRRSTQLGCSQLSELLIPASRETDTCFGDSGGGVFERTGDVWRLIAITSRSTLPKHVLCGEGGIYVRIDAVENWLEGMRE